jgi:hypothetical protein
MKEKDDMRKMKRDRRKLKESAELSEDFGETFSEIFFN